jgi:hypothetical protein
MKKTTTTKKTVARISDVVDEKPITVVSTSTDVNKCVSLIGKVIETYTDQLRSGSGDVVYTAAQVKDTNERIVNYFKILLTQVSRGCISYGSKTMNPLAINQISSMVLHALDAFKVDKDLIDRCTSAQHRECFLIRLAVIALLGEARINVESLDLREVGSLAVSFVDHVDIGDVYYRSTVIEQIVSIADAYSALPEAERKNADLFAQCGQPRAIKPNSPDADLWLNYARILENSLVFIPDQFVHKDQMYPNYPQVEGKDPYVGFARISPGTMKLIIELTFKAGIALGEVTKHSSTSKRTVGQKDGEAPQAPTWVIQKNSRCGMLFAYAAFISQQSDPLKEDDLAQMSPDQANETKRKRLLEK